MRLTTTYRLLGQHDACEDRYDHLKIALRKRGHRGAIPLSLILEVNGFLDALWALRAVPCSQFDEMNRIARLFTCDCTTRVLPLYEARYPDDNRVRNALEYAHLFVVGAATEAAAAKAAAGAAVAAWEAASTWAAAKDAARDAAAVGDAARAAAAVRNAVWAAARDASLAAAGVAAGEAAAAAVAAAVAVWDAAWDGAGDGEAEREWQTDQLRRYLDGEIES